MRNSCDSEPTDISGPRTEADIPSTRGQGDHYVENAYEPKLMLQQAEG